MKLNRSNNYAFVQPHNHIGRRHETSAIELSKTTEEPKDSYDVIIIGSGIGGLSCGAMLSYYGYSVAVLESHYTTGGCAHGFEIKDPKGMFYFDTGPSFFSGINPDLKCKASNPLRLILEATGESVDCIPYETFGLKIPEGDYIHTSSFGSGVLQSISKEGSKQWGNMMNEMKPLEYAVSAIPVPALRGDIGAALTMSKFLPNIMKMNPLENLRLTKPFSDVLEKAGVTDPFTRNWLDLLCFCLSGLPSNGTITAEMAMMLGEFYDPSAILDCPRGGARSIVDALVRAITKHGGSIFTSKHVDEILVKDNKAIGVQLKNNRKITANKAVVSNLSVWDLYSSKIINPKYFPPSYIQQRLDTPVGKSFMHIHLGFKISQQELSKLQAHYMYMKDWESGIDAEDNAALVSIPSVHDDSLAPEGYAVLHVYTPATEDYEKWSKVKYKSREYKDLKEERSRFLWEVVESILPDIRTRVHVVKVGTPLTHKRFLNRYKGSYGPAIVAGKESFPFPNTPVKGLVTCGDSVFPGIGVPAVGKCLFFINENFLTPFFVAGSGFLAANFVLELESIDAQLKLLDSLQEII